MTSPANTLPRIRLNQGDLILFQGDSITDAFHKPEEQSDAFRLGAGYALMIAAHLSAARPQAELRFANCGRSGSGSSHLVQRWVSDCLKHEPAVLSLLVGVNDARVLEATPARTVDVFEDNCRRLLARARTDAPSLQLVLCEPFALEVGRVRGDRMDDIARHGEAVRRLAKEFGAVCVPLQEAFAEAVRRAPAKHWLYDGIHPTAAGHWLVAQTWLAAVGLQQGPS